MDSASRGKVVSTRNPVSNKDGWIDLGDYKGSKLDFLFCSAQ